MLSKLEANRAARHLMDIVADGHQWTARTAEAQLPEGWTLDNIEDSDFFPATIENFERVFRAHATQEVRDAETNQ